MVSLMKEFIKPELIILIPILYFIGICLKNSNFPDNKIPYFLGLIGTTLAMLWMVASTDIAGTQQAFMIIIAGIIQGIIFAGVSVYINQLIKQSRKK